MKTILLLIMTAWCCSSCESPEEVVRYPSGEVSTRAPLDSAGRYDGDVRHFYKDGTLESVTPFHHHLINGTVKGYYPTGKIKSTQDYRDGYFHGWYKVFYPDGHLKSTVKFNRGVKVDTLRNFYANGELQELIVYDSTGRKIDFGVWKANGQRAVEYIQPLYLSDSDTILQGQDYAFEIILANRRSHMVSVVFTHPIAGLDSIQVLPKKKKYIIRRPKLGQHSIDALVNEQWRRKSSDTIWTTPYKVEHKFTVLRNKPL